MSDQSKRSNPDPVNPQISPEPPLGLLKFAGHHWLEDVDTDGHSFGRIVLFWEPSAKRWCHSGLHGTGTYYNAAGFHYIGPVQEPSSQQDY